MGRCYSSITSTTKGAGHHEKTAHTENDGPRHGTDGLQPRTSYAKVKYSGPLYRDSNGGGQGKTVNGTYTVKYYYTGRKCGVHIDGLGWVPESGCTVIG